MSTSRPFEDTRDDEIRLLRNKVEVYEAALDEIAHNCGAAMDDLVFPHFTRRDLAAAAAFVAECVRRRTREFR